jgi:methylated-DNA-[protein]-cysteine S-methyltransferase
MTVARTTDEGDADMNATEPGIALFETAIGVCGISWSECGITGVQLPAAREDLTWDLLRRRARRARELPAPARVADAIEGIMAVLAGEAADLSKIVLDLAGVEQFDRRVADVARTIPAGETLTYGEIAARIGAPGEAREVGAALGRNRFPIIVPCHRVIAANGRLGGFSAPGGARTKLRLLEIERRANGATLALFEGDGLAA